MGEIRQKKPRSKSSAKKKRKRKPGTEDKLAAVIIVAALIAAAGIGCLLIITLNQDKAPVSAIEAPLADSAPVHAPEEPPPPEIKAVPASGGEARPGPAAGSPAPAPVANTVQASGGEPRPGSAAPSPAPAPVANTVPASPAPSPIANTVPASGIGERPVSKGKLAFVIDDAGYNLGALEPFLKLDFPLTIAVLPGLDFSAEAARRIRAAGKEVFLHQPMESLGGNNPGPGAIRSGMNREEIRGIIIKNLEEIGPVAGMNNHEGSRITMDGEIMEIVLALCRERGLIFLDSRTTAETAVPAAARRLGLNIAERDVFVDNEPERASMNSYINTGLKKAELNGTAIFIGHVQSAELAPLLASLAPSLIESGYSFSRVSALVRGTGL